MAAELMKEPTTPSGTDRMEQFGPLRAAFPAGPVLSLFGSSQSTGSSLTLTSWSRLPQLLVRRGVHLLNGGYGGTMADFAASMRSHGGTAVGLISNEIDDVSPAHTYTHVLRVATAFQRLEALIRLGDAHAFLSGGIGTFTELTAVLWLADRGLLPQRRVLLLCAEWRKTVDVLSRNRLLFRSASPLDRRVRVVVDPEELEDALEDAFAP